MKLAVSILSRFGFAPDDEDEIFAERLRAMTARPAARPRRRSLARPSLFRGRTA